MWSTVGYLIIGCVGGLIGLWIGIMVGLTCADGAHAPAGNQVPTVLPKPMPCPMCAARLR